MHTATATATAIRITGIVFAIVSVIVLGLNLVTDRSELWAIWPVWGFAMIAGSIVASFRLRRVVLGIWLGGGFVLVIGLVVIDLFDGNDWWAFWPAGAWLVLGAIFTALSVDLLATIPTHAPRQPEDT